MATKFLTDVETLRQRARKHVEDGPVTETYKGNKDTIIKILNEALATEIVCVLRYKQHYFTASGFKAEAVANEFLEHATEEQVHADRLAQRICQLGGNPEMDPSKLLGSSHSEYIECETVEEMVKENLVAERIAVDSYREMISYIGDTDPTTRRMLEEILEKEEEHADDLASFLQ